MIAVGPSKFAPSGSLSHSLQPTEPPSPSSTLSSARSPRRTRHFSNSPPSSSEIEHWKNEALTGSPLTDCDGETLIHVVAALRSERDSLLTRRSVPEAKAADQAMVRTREVSTHRLKCQARDSVQADLRQKLKSAIQELKELQEVVDRQEENMNEIFESEIQAMIDRHEAELQKLDTEWVGPNRERKYNRTSCLLRVLRNQAALLLKERKYGESRFVDTRADKIEQFETDEGHRRMEADYLYQLGMMEQRHEKEAEELCRKLNLKRGEWKTARDFELNILQKRIELIEGDMEEKSDLEKVWARFHRTDGDPDISRETGVLHKHLLNIGEYNTLQLPPLRASAVAKHTMKKLNRSMKLSF
jgi:YesN/AraC family two-component response regulator